MLSGKLKIGAKLGAAFAVMVVMLMALAGSAAWLMSGNQQRVERITEEKSQEIKHIAFAYSRVLRETAGLRSVMMLPDAESKKSYIAKLLKYREEFNASLKSAQSLFDQYGATGEESALIKGLVAAYADLSKRIDEVASLSLAGKTPEAIQAWNAADKTYRKVQNDIEALTTLEYKINDQLLAETKAGYTASLQIMGGILAGAVVLALLLGSLITRAITRPLNAAVALANRVADGDLTSRVEVTSKDETGQLLSALMRMNDSLKSIVGEVRAATGSISGASQEIAAGNADLSRRTEQQASSLEETASSMEELTSTVKQTADNARQANQLAASASDVAVKGGEVVGRVVSTMSGISESSKKIADIIGVIDGIAFQTNILALNAAVEAARAGEQGRGFAVVASEVRTLAQRSAAAAKEIKGLITDSVSKVEDGTRLVDEAGNTMEQIVTSVRRVTDIMREITDAAQEQSSGIEQVNQAVTQMDQATQQNAALVEEAAAAAESMQDQARALSRAVAVFKIAQDGQAAGSMAAAQGMIERRGPNRAENVARLPAKTPKSKLEPRVAPKKTGTDDQWSEF